MAIYKIISIATLTLLSLAIAGGVEYDSEIRHFDAQSAIDSASDAELEFITEIKLKTNTNWNMLANTPSDDYEVVKNEIIFGLDLIIDSKFKMDETPKMISSQTLASDLIHEDLYEDDQTTPIILAELKLSESIDPASPSEFSSQLVIGSAFLETDINSKLGQIEFDSKFE